MRKAGYKKCTEVEQLILFEHFIVHGNIDGFDSGHSKLLMVLLMKIGSLLGSTN